MKKVTEQNPLLTALKNKDWPGAEKLIVAGAEVNISNAAGETPLILSLGARPTHARVTQALLVAGANPNVFTCGKVQPPSPFLTELLHYNYPAEVVELALAKGADPNIKDSHEQETPLFTALRNNNFAAINLLMREGADFTACNTYGQCVLSCIDTFNTRKGIQALEIMLKRGLPPDTRAGNDRTGITLMEEAVRYGYTEIMITLLNHGADINNPDFLGRTPLMQGISKENTLRLFIANAADLNAQDREGWTALMHAVNATDGDAVKFILEYSDQSFDLNLKNNAGETALTMAQKQLAAEKDPERRWSLERSVYFLENEMGVAEKVTKKNPAAANSRT